MNSGIGVSYWPASPCSLAGPLTELNFSPQLGSGNSGTGPPDYRGWRASTTTLCKSRLLYIPQSGTKNLATGVESEIR
jgi:hypothetical protein